ncbi:MAG: N-acetyltransferase [Chitinophagaceae bacterium]|nr:N-acetyltransferase [Chitinophagaceae bacterium]
MVIQHKKIGDKGLFFAEQDGHILAELSYSSPANDRMVIEHTEVSEELKGKKVGNKLVHTAVAYAREHKLKIVPLCSFANAVFKRDPELKDVLYE